MARVVVGYDGSEDSESALRCAIAEADARAATLDVVTAVRIVPSATYVAATLHGDYDTLVEHLHAAASAAAERAVADAVAAVPTRSAVTVNVEAVEGSPAASLLERAHDADLLVVGRRGTSALARVLVGSVSSELVRHARCPVLVVPHASVPRPRNGCVDEMASLASGG